MSRRLLVLLVLALSVLGIEPLNRTVAQTVPDPSIYALMPMELPAGAQIVDSRIATNGTVIEQHLQPGVPLPDGRLTGYYLQARTFTASGGVASVLSYLASVFLTNRDAQQAFADQHAFWDHEVATLTPNAYEEDLGDFFLAHLYTLHDANGNTDSELFFQRGAVFFEVTLQNFGTLSRDDRRALLLGIARSLESRANGTPAPREQTSTAVPTATPVVTATRTPTPKPVRTARPTATRTVVKPRPTATRSVYGRPVRENNSCKQGHRRVQGRCTKIKKP